MNVRQGSFAGALPAAVPVLIVALLASGAGGVARAGNSLELIKLDRGIVQGERERGVIAFRGIRFAAPAVGALRWRAPQPVAAWPGIERAARYGADCMQVPFPGDAAPLRVAPAEDCLYLNIWRPAHRAAHGYPVMVWIYGGGFVNGGTSPAEYDGSAFARDGVVLVSFNYRLGNFGFFAHPALSAESRGAPLGNYAFMDQIAALRWVQRHIGEFGGDPANVTIFGESAGGMSVHVLLTTPLAQGLYAKAIVESGGGRPGVLGMRALAGGPRSAESRGLALAQRFGIAGEGAAALAQLRAIPAEELLSGLNMATAGRDPTYVGGPILDGELVLGAPTELYALGKGARVPVMIGANSMDIGFVPAKTLDELYATFGPDAARARELYAAGPSEDLRLVAARVGGDQAMVEPARAIARLLADRGQPVYEYRFSYVASSLRATLSGAPHASEIPYVFDTVAAHYGKALTSADRAAARAIHRYWVAFARSGTAQVAGLPPWPRYERASDELMNFTERGPLAGPDPWKARLDLAERANERKARDAEPPGQAR